MAVTTVWMAAVALLACLRSSVGLAVPSSYDTLLNVVINIMAQDEYWTKAFDETVYHQLDRTWYPNIVDKELLVDARVECKTETDAAAAQAKGEAIRPMRFLQNVMRKWYRIGSVLEMAVEVLHKSLTCVSYKHVVHLIKLIRVEISRTTSKRKAFSWSGKAIAAVAGIVIKMAGLQHVDEQMLQAAAFLDVYSDIQAGTGRYDKFDLTPALDNLSRLMLEYIGQNCVVAPADEHAVAKELDVFVTPNLYSTIKSKSIKTATYKEMFKSIMVKISQLYDALPDNMGMSLDRWNEILHFKRNVEEQEHYEFYRITRF